jgi:hypothetical protein
MGELPQSELVRAQRQAYQDGYDAGSNDNRIGTLLTGIVVGVVGCIVWSSFGTRILTRFSELFS